MNIARTSDGKLPAYAWPGGYPIIYILADCECLCATCANGGNGSDASEGNNDPQWDIIGAQVNWEGTALTCGHCMAILESAYGGEE